MTKHIAGFILFSFIVGVSGVIAFVFGELPQPEKTNVLNVPRFESRTRCSKRSYEYFDTSKTSVKVVQAVFNERTKLLDTDLVIEREDSSTQSVIVTLQFFAKDSKGARYLASENYYFKPDFGNRNVAILATPSRLYQWLDNLTSQETLYVIAETASNKDGYSKNQPVFDEHKAVSVISLKGR